MPSHPDYDDSDEDYWDEDWTDEDQPDESPEEYSSECPACGGTIYDDADVCPHCGEFIFHDSHNPWKGRKLWWIVLGLLGIVAVIWMLTLGP